MSSDKFHCTNGHCLSDCVLLTIDYDEDFPPGFCPHAGGVVYWKKCETTEKKPTLFDRITTSPEVLAEKFVIPSFVSDEGYMSVLIPAIFRTKEKAIAATVAKLKEVAE